MNKKNEYLYDIIFTSVIFIITQNKKLLLNLKYIITDNEYALLNSVIKNFPNSRRIGCYYHYKNNLLINLREYGLYKDEDK